MQFAKLSSFLRKAIRVAREVLPSLIPTNFSRSMVDDRSYSTVRARDRWKTRWFQIRISPRPASRPRGRCTTAMTASAASRCAPRTSQCRVSAPTVKSRGNMAGSTTPGRLPSATLPPFRLILQVSWFIWTVKYLNSHENRVFPFWIIQFERYRIWRKVASFFSMLDWSCPRLHWRSTSFWPQISIRVRRRANRKRTRAAGPPMTARKQAPHLPRPAPRYLRQPPPPTNRTRYFAVAAASARYQAHPRPVDQARRWSFSFSGFARF